MDIQTFLELFPGQWFAQRTSYALIEGKEESNKAQLVIEGLASTEPEVVKIRQTQHIKPEETLITIKNSWDNSVDWGKTKQQGSSLLIFVPDATNSNQGKVLQLLPRQSVTKGEYCLGEDKALTLSLQAGEFTYQERVWFVSPNLRLRTAIKYKDDETIQTSFYSEIRRTVNPEK